MFCAIAAPRDFKKTDREAYFQSHLTSQLFVSIGLSIAGAWVVSLELGCWSCSSLVLT